MANPNFSTPQLHNDIGMTCRHWNKGSRELGLIQIHGACCLLRSLPSMPLKRLQGAIEEFVASLKKIMPSS